jgi:hypothetical protein
MRWRIGVLLAGTAVIAIAGYAVGADTSSDNLILCATKKGGDLSLAAKGRCGKGEKKLTLSQKGQQGEKGPQGAGGPQGAPGPAGSPTGLAPEPIHYVTGPSSDTCFEKPGTFCRATGGTVQWANLSFLNPSYGNVGYYKDAAGFVHLSGVAFDNSSGGVGVGFSPRGPFYLPPGYRPSVIEVFTAPSAQSGSGTTFNSSVIVEVEPSGAVVVRDNGVVGLSGVVFRP